MKRRDFLRTSGAIIVSFAFDGAFPETMPAQTSDPGKPVDPREVDSFLAIHPDGSVTIYTSKVDVGTGLRIAISQMVAEELDIPVDRVTVVEGDTAITPNHGGTGGSTGIPQGGVELRRAAATARQALMKLGAQPGTNIGALAGGKRLNLKVDPNAPLKDPKTYTIVGRPILRPDVPDKCTGRNVYVQDFSLPGMLHGRVIHPPSIGAKLMSLDESSIRTITGARVVRIQNFLGIVAPDEWAAIRTAKELKVTWTEEQGLPGSDNLDRHVRESVPDHDETIVNKGDPAAALPGTTKQLSALYAWPIQSHASLGPSCAIADVRPKEPRSGQRPKGRTACGRTSHEYSEFPRTNCGSFSSMGPVPTAVTATTMRLPMRCCYPGQSENLYACSGCAKMNTRGIPKDRRRSWKYAAASITTIGSRHGRRTCGCL